MATSFKIVIDAPCTEKWGNMQSTDGGRFCNTCEKVVTDFTGFTDQELAKWFKEHNGKGCGRLNPEQLNKLIIVKSRFSIQKFKPSLIAASLVALLSLPKLGKASTKINHPIVLVEQKFNIGDKKPNPQQDSLVTINGQVVDEMDKQPIAGLTVVIKGTDLKTITNENGKFTIKLKRNIAKPVLKFLGIGYHTKEIQLNLKKNIPIVIKMKMAPVILGGLGIIKGKTTFDKMRGFFNV